jgi:hypothetical protein
MTDDIMDKLPDEELTEEEHEALLLRSEHAIVPPLSPAALAVLNAARQYEINPECYSREIAATTLRTAADQICMKRPLGDTDADAGVFAAHHAIQHSLLAIADELEAM